MTPKEKADSIKRDFMRYASSEIEGKKGHSYKEYKRNIQGCALVCINEMFAIAMEAGDSSMGKYLSEVKHELLKPII